VRPGRILAVDYGSKNIGLATCDELGVAVRPLPSFPNRGRRDLLARLKSEALQSAVVEIVVGLPRNMNGSEGPAAARVRRLIAADSLVRLQLEEQEELRSRHRDEPWYDDALRALEQEDAGDYADDAELDAITRRFWPMYFGTFDERAAKYVDESLVGERGNPFALKLFNEGIAEWDLRGDLAAIEAPTLVITGEYDFICGPACAEDIASGIASSEKVLVEDCGHFTFVEQPEEFRAAIERFLA